jgi:trehalose-6-phosphatase
VDKVEKHFRSLTLQSLIREFITIFQGSVEILKDQYSIEVRPHFADKASFINQYLSILKSLKCQLDFVFCCGIDTSDENLFASVENTFARGRDDFVISQQSYFTVTIGGKSTNALFYVDSKDIIRNILLRLWKGVIILSRKEN